MPTLKDLTCSIELSDSQEPLPELGTIYGDAVVETFVPVSDRQQSFVIHLSSRNFIAPGIAMFVSIDGVYQCNRNRQNLKVRKPPDRRSLVDFKVRQKEERQTDGSMIARQWTFEDLDHASAEVGSPDTLANSGCIEVVVLRCAGPRNAKTAANMNLDGASDYPDYRFGRDSRSRVTAYDDRDLFVNTASNKDGPPPVSYRSPYAETVRSREMHGHNSSYGQTPPPFASERYSKRAYSRNSEPVSPGPRPRRDILAPGFQYGSGPLPLRSRAETNRNLMDEVATSGTPRGVPAFDSAMLERIVAEAVQRGVEESKKKDTFDRGRARYEKDTESSSRVPGAWPTSPTRASKHRSHKSTLSERYGRDHGRDEHVSAWEQHAETWKRRPSGSRAETRVAWDEQPGWEKRSEADGRGPPDDHPVDPWQAEETWSTKQPDGWERVRRRSKSRDRTVRDLSPHRAYYNPDYISHRQSSRRGRSKKSQSRSHAHWEEDSRTSSDDNEGWTHIEAPPAPSPSDRSASTLKPPHPRSQAQGDRRKSRLIPKPNHEQRLSHPFTPSPWPTHPVLVTNAPTRSASATQAPAPPPTWGCAVSARNESAATHPPPAPFSASVAQSRQSSDSSRGLAKAKAENKEKETHRIWCDKSQAEDTWEAAEHASEVERESAWITPNATAVGVRHTHTPSLPPPPPPPPPPNPTPTARDAHAPGRSARDTARPREKPGTLYEHPSNRPVYTDALSAPYAVFRFRCVPRGEGPGCRDEGEGYTERWVRGQRVVGGSTSEVRKKG